MRKAFKQGLIKATESTDSIIFTNANNKLVGEAVEEYTFYNKINIVGICAWKTVAFREQLLVRKSIADILFFYFINFIMNFKD
jgi:hypothetical protein